MIWSRTGYVSTISVLTGGDMCKPIVAVGFNAERFDGHNLALRLVALGYNNVLVSRRARGVGGGRPAGDPGRRAGVVG